jgi:hypothetical protein
VTVIERPTFRLERFEWRPPDRIELTGSWLDVGDVVLTTPLLVLRGGDHEIRLRAEPDPVGIRPDRGRWRATFMWPQEPAEVPNATLYVGNDFSLSLPSLGRNRPRFGRTVLKANPGAAGTPVEIAEEQFELHTALVLAREDAEAAREEARESREATRAAHASLARERTRGKAETARMREALVAAEEMGKRSVHQLNAINDLLKVELQDVRSALESERAGTAEHQRRANELQGELDGARRRVLALQDDVEAVNADLDRTRAALQAAVEEERRNAHRAQDELQSRHGGEIAALQERLAQQERAAAEAEARAVDAERVRTALEDAQRRVEELAGVRAELEAAQRAARVAEERSATLTARLTAIRRAIDPDDNGAS